MAIIISNFKINIELNVFFLHEQNFSCIVYCDLFLQN